MFIIFVHWKSMLEGLFYETSLALSFSQIQINFKTFMLLRERTKTFRLSFWAFGFNGVSTEFELLGSTKRPKIWNNPDPAVRNSPKIVQTPRYVTNLNFQTDLDIPYIKDLVRFPVLISINPYHSTRILLWYS